MAKKATENHSCNKPKTHNTAKKRSSFSQTEKMCFYATVFFTAFFCTLLCLYSTSFLFAGLPVYVAVKLSVRKICADLFPQKITAPKMLAEKPEHADGVLVILKTDISDVDEIRISLEKTERSYLLNNEENVYFALLCQNDVDVKRCREEYERNILFAKEKIITFRKKYGDCFFLFVKEQNLSYVKSTLFAITCFLFQKSDPFAQSGIKPNEDVCKSIRYVFNVGQNVNLGSCAVKDAVEILKGLNKSSSHIKKEEYAQKSYALSCLAKYNPSYEATSLFTEAISSFSKFETENGNVFNMLCDGALFENTLFEKEYLYKLLIGDFKKEKLSLQRNNNTFPFCKTIAVSSKVSLSEDAPKNAICYFKVRKREFVEEIKNLALATKNEITAEKDITFAGFAFAEKLVCSFLPLSSMICAIVGLVFVKKHVPLLLSVAFSPYVLPTVHKFSRSLKNAVKSLFRKPRVHPKEYTGIPNVLCCSLLLLFFLPKIALVQLETLCFLFFGKRAKDLVPFERVGEDSFSPKCDGELLDYVQDSLACAVVGAVCFLLCDIFFFRTLFLLWFFEPFLLFLLSSFKRKSKKISKSDADENFFSNANSSDKASGKVCENVKQSKKNVGKACKEQAKFFEEPVLSKGLRENKNEKFSDKIGEMCPGQDENFFTLFGRNAHFYVCRDGIFLASLEKNEKKQAVRIEMGEGNFDVCENSKFFYVERNVAVYEGVCDSARYRLEAFCHVCENEIFLRLQTQNPQNVRLSVFLNGAKGISCVEGGNVCVKRFDKAFFLFGEELTQKTGASFEISENFITASFFKPQDTEDFAHEYVFAFAAKDSGKELAISVGFELERASYNMLCAGKLACVVMADFSKIPTFLRYALEKYFVLPKDGICSCAVIENRGEKTALETLLLVYSKKGEFEKAFLEKMPYFNDETTISKSLYAVALAEYVKRFSCAKICEINVGNAKIYRIVLSGIFDLAKRGDAAGREKSFLLVALVSLMSLCDFLCDTRTYIELWEILKKIRTNESCV